MRSGNDTDLESDQVFALGRIMYWSSHIEASLRELVIDLSNSEAFGQIGEPWTTTTATDWAAVSHLAADLVLLAGFPPAEASYLNSQISAASRLLEFRSELLHRRWHSLDADLETIESHSDRTETEPHDSFAKVADIFVAAAQSIGDCSLVVAMAPGFVEKLHLVPFAVPQNWLTLSSSYAL